MRWGGGFTFDNSSDPGWGLTHRSLERGIPPPVIPPAWIQQFSSHVYLILDTNKMINVHQSRNSKKWGRG